LYSIADGSNVWLDKAKDELLDSGPNLLLADEEGYNGNVRADMTNDRYGVFDVAEDLLTYLRGQFVDNGYEAVHFFPYNWMNDIEAAVNDLERHINENGYDKIVLLTHSTGGLVASAYIAKGNNASKVEKAVLIAPPFFGTNFALGPIETGFFDAAEKMVDEKFGIFTGPVDFLLGIKSKIRDSIKKITKNDPMIYQLLPSDEYHKLMPQLYEEEYEMNIGDLFTRRIRPAANIGEFYALLNGSGNINTNLTNGFRTRRSHFYLRNNLLKGNVVEVIKKVNYEIFAGKGIMTPTIAIYSASWFGGSDYQDIIVKNDGDGTVHYYSATANETLPNIRKYTNTYHTGEDGNIGFLNTQGIFYDIANSIRNISISVPSFALSDEADNATGMSSYLKLRIEADRNVDILITDAGDKTVASIKNGMSDGFDKLNFNYIPLAVGDDVTKAIIYLPNSGYKVGFSCGDLNTPIGFTVNASTLDYGGFNTSMAKYEAFTTELDGKILEFDMLSKMVEDRNIGTLVPNFSPESVAFHSQWELASAETLRVGETKTLALSGADVTAGNIRASDLSWSSSDPDVVSVSDAGVITGLKGGEAVVFATAQNASYKFSRSVVTVTANANPNPNNPSMDSSGGGGGGCAAGLGALGLLALAVSLASRKRRER
jgi:pimeloyl-ACP methyl ester carboxylesterase